MEDYLSIKIESLPGQGIVEATNDIIRTLPIELKRQVNKVFSAYLRLYGVDRVYECLNNRTIGEILVNFDPKEDTRPIEEGERDGTRWRLFRAPDSDSKSSVPSE
jgi:hypothetical protein